MHPSRHEVDLPPDADVLLAPTEPRAPGPPCPVDRLPSRRRNQICIAVITLGLLNLIGYTVSYAVIGGDALNGHREVLPTADGGHTATYFVRGHFIRTLHGRERVVSQAVWMYSYLHSISIPLTSGALLISMLVLARPHILATMRGGWLSGRRFIQAFGGIVVIITVGIALLFTWQFALELTHG